MWCVIQNKQGNTTTKGRLYLLHICFNRWWAVAGVSPPLLCVDSYTHNIEAVSCDEALVDITEILTETRLTPDELANAIRTEIKAQTKCTASVGMGKFLISFCLQQYLLFLGLSKLCKIAKTLKSVCVIWNLLPLHEISVNKNARKSS